MLDSRPQTSKRAGESPNFGTGIFDG
jgi:hypothetical protein